jgi:hypothetical protein
VRRRGALLLVVGLAVSGCGGSEESPPVAHEGAQEVSWAEQHADLVRTFDEQLAPLDLRISRAGVTERYGEGEYDAEGVGGHLAVYVAPTRRFTPDDYVNRIAPVAQVFVPSVFEAFPDIRSFDVCQEPSGPHEETPKPVTQLLVDREQSALTEWSSADLTTLVQAGAAVPNRLTLIVRGEAQTSPVWQSMRPQLDGGS